MARTIQSTQQKKGRQIPQTERKKYQSGKGLSGNKGNNSKSMNKSY